MDFKALIDFLQGTEGGEEFAKQLSPHIDEYDRTKTDLSNANDKLALLGDRDLAKMIALQDHLTNEGLDTPEKLVDFKAKTEGLEQTVNERDEAIKTLRADLENKEATYRKEADDKLLEAAVLVKLAGIRGEKEAVFNTAIKTEMPKFSKNEQGEILYDGKPVDQAHEYFRNTYGNGFSEKPQGTGLPPKPNQPQEKNNNSEYSFGGHTVFGDVVREMK